MGSVSEFAGKPFKWSGQTLWQKVVDSVQNHGENLALICTHQPKGTLNLPNTDLDDDQYRQNPYLRLKYRHFGDAINHMANALLARGVQPDTPIITFVPNTVEYHIAMWAAFKLGCIWVPINPRNLLNKEEVTHMIKLALSWKSSRSAFVLAGDAKTADSFDELDSQYQLDKFIVTDEKRSGWGNYSDIYHSAPESHPSNPSFATQIGQTGSTVMFTSGTTSLPKGVGGSANRFAIMVEQRDTKTSYFPSDVFCVTAPNNHAIGMIWCYFALAVGATIVHPGPAFDPKLIMDVALRESCTRMALVPTMVHALLVAKGSQGGKLLSLRSISLGGSMADPETIDKCLHDLGADHVENVWGMTEGCFTVSDGQPIQNFISGNVVAVGCAPPGCKIRICAPDSKTPLPIGETGELHISSVTLNDSYINKKSEEFYRDDQDGSNWFITGDQATVDEQGRVFMTGRYKEMIIRGGENIAPAAIEAVVNKDPKLTSRNVQIVGAKDTYAGEVPVAVYTGSPDLTVAQRIQQTVLTKIGPAHVPDQVIALKELGQDEYPRTMAGKVQKNKLTVLVQEFRDRQSKASSTGNFSDVNLAQTVKKIWTRALGYQVDENLSFASFADSITIMKTRDMIAKETGKQISLSDMVSSENIAGQIKMLQQLKTAPTHSKSKPRAPMRKGPVTMNDVVVFRQKPAAYKTGKAFIESVLAKYALGWDDIAGITPAYDFSTKLNQTGIMDSWSFSIATLTKLNSLQDARHAIYKTLRNNPVFSSFFVWNQKALQTESAVHIIMHQTDKYLNQCVHDHNSVKTVADFKALAQEYPNPDAATLPGPLFDAYIIYIEDVQRVGILMRLHHAVMDASSSLIFSDDLDSALGDKPLAEHIDYQTWTDSYFSLRNSFDAQTAVSWHVDRLKGVAAHRDGMLADYNEHQAREESIRAQFDVPSILTLRQTHSQITAPVVLKTAFSLVTSHRTQHTHAVFCNHQASRESFPFIPQALKDLAGSDRDAYSATNVAGPTIEDVINLVAINPEETVLEFFHRMQVDQDNLTKYAAAPMGDIIRHLGETDGPMVLEAIRNTIFNWVPGLGSQTPDKYDHMQMLAAVVKPEVAFCMNAGLGGDKGYTMIMDLLGTALPQVEHWKIAKEVERVTCWLCDEQNWNRKVGDFQSCLDAVNGVDGQA